MKGEKIRSFNHIKHLSRSHTIHLACLMDRGSDWEHARTLEKWCASVEGVYRSEMMQKVRAVLGLFTSRPLTAHAQYSTKLQNIIDKRLVSERIDRILLSSSGMAEYVKGLSGIPRIMDFVDVDSEKWRSYVDHHGGLSKVVYQVEATRLAHYEDAIARSFDHCLVVSEEEARVLRNRVPACPVSVIPNGVDLEWFNPDQIPHARDANPTVVFTGAMDYTPNVDAVCYFSESVMPIVSKAVPDVRFLIVGSNPVSPVRALGRAPGTTVTGTVSDVRPYLASAWLAVAPLRVARGLQNKVLEAMAMRLPVVGTSAAFRGTQATGDDGICIADRPEEMAAAIVRLVGAPKHRQDAGMRARQYVERAHRWEDHVGQLASILELPSGQGRRISR